jgi:enoyl-CoA hydratase/carnithine racemase
MRPVEAEEALAIGLLDGLEHDACSAALELASAVTRLDPAAVARTKAVVRTATGVVDALAQEREENRASWSGSTAGL